MYIMVGIDLSKFKGINNDLEFVWPFSGSRPKSKSENSKNGKLNFALELDLPHYLKWPQRADAAVVTPQRTRPKDKKGPQFNKTISKTSKRSKSSQADGKVYYIWKLNYLDLRWVGKQSKSGAANEIEGDSYSKFSSHKFVSGQEIKKKWFVRTSKPDTAVNTANSGDSLET